MKEIDLIFFAKGVLPGTWMMMHFELIKIKENSKPSMFLFIASDVLLAIVKLGITKTCAMQLKGYECMLKSFVSVRK